jgi:uncharacterized membrane protein (UPF0127 family)
MDMKNKNLLKSFLIVIVFFLVGFLLINKPIKDSSLENIKEVSIAGQSIKVDLALTDEAHELGLSGRKELANDRGMLFVFDRPGKYPFWMKGMNFPIDMIWIGEDMSVVYIKKDAQPETETVLETYEPDTDAKYVLEVVSGFSDKNNLKIGDQVEFVY